MKQILQNYFIKSIQQMLQRIMLILKRLTFSLFTSSSYIPTKNFLSHFQDFLCVGHQKHRTTGTDNKKLIHIHMHTRTSTRTRECMHVLKLLRRRLWFKMSYTLNHIFTFGYRMFLMYSKLLHIKLISITYAPCVYTSKYIPK